MMAENEATVEAGVKTEEVKTLKHMRVVKCTFGVDPKGNERYERAYPGAKTNRTTQYNYLTDLEVKKGNVACVETPHGYTLVTIQDVGPDLLFGDLPGHKWIIDTVDIQGHQERREKAER